MSYESGSRFGSANNSNNNYFGNSYPQTNLPTSSNQNFPPSDPIPLNNMETPIQNNQQAMENTQPRVDPQVVPLSSHLAAFGQIASNSGNPELLISYMKPTERGSYSYKQLSSRPRIRRNTTWLQIQNYMNFIPEILKP